MARVMIEVDLRCGLLSLCHLVRVPWSDFVSSVDKVTKSRSHQRRCRKCIVGVCVCDLRAC